MFKRPTRWMTTAALVLGALTACNEGPGPTEVSVPFGESFSADLIDGSLYDTDLTTEAASLYTRTTGAALVTTQSYEAGSVAIAIIGPGGGTISSRYHSLQIPRNAVSEDTEFRMEVVPGTHIQFKFTQGSWGLVEKGPAGEEIANRSLAVMFGVRKLPSGSAWTLSEPTVTVQVSSSWA